MMHPVQANFTNGFDFACSSCPSMAGLYRCIGIAAGFGYRVLARFIFSFAVRSLICFVVHVGVEHRRLPISIPAGWIGCQRLAGAQLLRHAYA